MMINAFLFTMGVGLAIALTYFIIMFFTVVIVSWDELLDAFIGAMKRYATRKMVVKAYYDVKNSHYVKEWELPEPYFIEFMRKKNV